MNLNELVEYCLNKYPTHTKNFYEYCDNIGISYDKPEKYCTVSCVYTRLLSPYIADLSFLICIVFMILNTDLVSLVGLPITLIILNLVFCLAIFKCITPFIFICSTT